MVHALADQAPRSRLQLHLIRKEVPAPVLSLDEVKEIALAAGLTHGLRFSELTPEALSAVQGVFDLAVGTPAVPGRDASIKYVFQDDPLRLIWKRPSAPTTMNCTVPQVCRKAPFWQ